MALQRMIQVNHIRRYLTGIKRGLDITTSVSYVEERAEEVLADLRRAMEEGTERKETFTRSKYIIIEVNSAPLPRHY